MENKHRRHDIASASSLFSASNTVTTSYPHYDVFLNHRGPDVKNGFARDLYNRLSPCGLKVFFDEFEMQPGHGITSQIKQAIETASIHIAIFSPTYADSRWCLEELEYMLKMDKTGHAFIPIFYEVEPSVLRSTGKDRTEAYAKALRKHEKKHGVNFKTIQKWRGALDYAAGRSGLELKKFDSDFEYLLAEIVGHVLDIREKNRLKYFTKEDFETIVLSHEKLQHRGKVEVLGIVGPGGVGKTTLAYEFFNSKKSAYSGSCFLSDVKESSRFSLQSKLYKDLVPDNTCDKGISKLFNLISSRKVLIVLDDVDHANQMDVVLLYRNLLSSDSLILVTSRDKNVLGGRIREESIYNLTRSSTSRPISNLILAGCWLENLPPNWLAQFTRIEELWIRDSPNLKGLSSFVQLLNQLTEFTIMDCGVQSLLQDPANMDSLRALRVYNCPLGEVLFRKGDKVRKIMFRIETKFRAATGNPFTEGVYPHLQHIWINSCADLVKVESLPTPLITLDLSCCKRLKEIDGLRYLTRLEQLNISGCEEVEKLQSLRLLTSLKELKASRCYKLKSIRGLAHLSTNLRRVYVRECREILELPGVERLMSLEKLDASLCPKLQWGRGVLDQLRHRLEAGLHI